MFIFVGAIVFGLSTDFVVYDFEISFKLFSSRNLRLKFEVVRLTRDNCFMELCSWLPSRPQAVLNDQHTYVSSIVMQRRTTFCAPVDSSAEG